MLSVRGRQIAINSVLHQSELSHPYQDEAKCRWHFANRQGETRTRGLLLAKQAIFQLIYSPNGQGEIRIRGILVANQAFFQLNYLPNCKNGVIPIFAVYRSPSDIDPAKGQQYYIVLLVFKPFGTKNYTDTSHAAYSPYPPIPVSLRVPTCAWISIS